MSKVICFNFYFLTFYDQFTKKFHGCKSKLTRGIQLDIISSMNILKRYKNEHGLTFKDIAWALGCSKISAIRYLSGKRDIPPEIAKMAEKNLGIPKHLLRPDIWDER